MKGEDVVFSSRIMKFVSFFIILCFRMGNIEGKWFVVEINNIVLDCFKWFIILVCLVWCLEDILFFLSVEKILFFLGDGLKCIWKFICYRRGGMGEGEGKERRDRFKDEMEVVWIECVLC